MRRTKIADIVIWVARIWGTIILIITLIALFQGIYGEKQLFKDWKSIALYIGLLFGLSTALKWELVGGVIATLGILISGFFHPLVMPPGILYIIHWFMSKTGETPHNTG